MARVLFLSFLLLLLLLLLSLLFFKFRFLFVFFPLFLYSLSLFVGGSVCGREGGSARRWASWVGG